MAAVELAWQQKADAVEVDVHVSKDKHVVAIHDPSARRTGGLNRKISKLDLEELRSLDFGLWKGAKWQGEKIPLLSEVLDSVPEGKKLFIEVKCGPEIIEPLSIVLNQTTVPASDIIMMHFDLQTLIKMKSEFPDYEILWLYEFLPLTFSFKKKELLRDILDTVQAENFSGVNIQNIKEFDHDYIQLCRERGLKVYCWVVNERERAEYLIEGGIDGITTDRPGWLRDQLKGNSD